MANHVRRQIREAAATLLTGLPSTGARVYQSRVHVLGDADLPCLQLTTNEEQAGISSIGSPPLLNRILNLQVRATAKASVNLDDALDEMIKEVETALNASVSANTLGGLAKQIDLNSIYIDMNADAEMPIGQATMSFNVLYKTVANAPDISI
jgi:hypothetical protein